jgi:hypothetical protein
MDGALINIVAKSHHEVADVNHDRSFHWHSFYPLAILVEDLQATDHILPEECEQLKIGVASKPNGVVCFLFSRRGGVVVEHSISTRISCSTVD